MTAPGPPRTEVFVVTVTVVLRARTGDAVSPDQICAALMELEDVVAVRADTPDQPVVYRVDVLAATEASAAEDALAPVGEVVAGAGLDAQVLAVAAVRDADRIERFRQLVDGDRQA